ncbi:MAG: hypothetical protein QGF00_19450 [Planctomycetota bacterium]|jgi:hypothetical protein|nr:hypothetical protein [Planctomycetota bacterium]
MKWLITSLSVLSLVFVFQSGQAEEAKKEKKAKKEKPKLEEITVTGKLVKKEATRKNKKTGEEKTVVSYLLEGADGKKTRLPAPRKKKGEEEAADPYAEHVDKNVTITGMGATVTKKNKKGEERTTTRIARVKSIVAQ